EGALQSRPRGEHAVDPLAWVREPCHIDPAPDNDVKGSTTMRTTRGLVAGIAAGALVLAGCVGGDDEDPSGGDTSRNADVESYTLAVTSNAALGAGAKNVEEATW